MTLLIIFKVCFSFNFKDQDQKLWQTTLRVLPIETNGINGISLLPYEWLLLISKSDLKTRLTLGGSCFGVFSFGAVLIYFELHPIFSN